MRVFSFITRYAPHVFVLYMGVTVAYWWGYAHGQRVGGDTVVCAMDRIANGQPVGAITNSAACNRIAGKRGAA